MAIDDAGFLHALSDPTAFTEPVELGTVGRDQLGQLLDTMVQIRVVEEFIADRVQSGVVKCPCHLAIGQEAIAAGVSIGLRRTDRVFGNHRSHGHFLAQGGTVYGLLAEILGKSTGCSHGMGGSMHLIAKDVGFWGSVPIVGATVPFAVGAALGAQRDGNGDVAVAYFGDGAMEEGAVHESLNFAAQFALPVLFVAENNFFSSHLHIRERQPADSLARFARAHQIRHESVDGNDVVAVMEATQRLLEPARLGSGPAFLEAVTYRWRGHVGASEDLDVGVQRHADLTRWKLRDPIARFMSALTLAGIKEAGDLAMLQDATYAECESAWAQAQLDPFPVETDLLDMVFGGHR